MLFKSFKNGAVTSLAIIAVIAGIATFGDLRLTTARANDSDDTYRQLTLFGDVFQRVRANYVESVTDEDLIEAAINGMLTSLDPHSTYLPDDNFKKVQQQTTGKFGGLGIEVTMENGFLKVVSPIDDTPAFDAGLQPEDLILTVDDESIVGITLSEAVEKLRGPIGSEVNITVQRADDEPFDVAIIRDEIKIRSVRSRLYDDIGYIRITTFSEQTSPGLKKAVEELTKEAENGLAGIEMIRRLNGVVGRLAGWRLMEPTCR